MTARCGPLRRGRSARGWLLAAAIALLALAACAKAPDARDPDARDPDAPRARGRAALAWLGEVRAAHASADAARDPAGREAALAALRTRAHHAVPAEVTADDAAGVRRDLFGRAARLALELGRADEARALVREGLALEGRDPFRAQLLLIAIDVARAQGDAAAEADARRRAEGELGLD